MGAKIITVDRLSYTVKEDFEEVTGKIHGKSLQGFNIVRFTEVYEPNHTTEKKERPRSFIISNIITIEP